MNTTTSSRVGRGVYNRRAGIDWVRRNADVNSILYFADEMFITGTGAEVCPVTEIDKRPVGNGKPGPITRQLIADFREYTKSGGDL